MGGAEVLTLGEMNAEEMLRIASSGGTQTKGLQRRLTRTLTNWRNNNNRDEHKSALEKMAHTAEWLRSAQQDEQEAQRLQFSRKVEERKQRQLRLFRGSLRKSPCARHSTGTEERSSFSDQRLGPMPEHDGRRAISIDTTTTDCATPAGSPIGPTPTGSPTHATPTSPVHAAP